MPRKKTNKQDVAAPESSGLSEDLTKPPQTPDELHDWLVRVLGVHIARTSLLPGHAAPFEYLCHVFFEGRFPRVSAPDAPNASSPDIIVWANRGGGKTFLGALATLLDLLFKPGMQIRILGGSLDQSLRMRAHLAAFLSHENLDAIPRRITARAVTILRAGKGQNSVAEVLAASQTSVRGTRVQKLRCDEVDLFDPEVWDAAQLVTRSMPCIGPWGEVVRGGVEALSTMHRPFGLMWNLVGPQLTPRVGATPPARENARPMRPTFRWGVLDVLEHCGPEHACARCILHPECEGRAKAIMIPPRCGHISVPDAAGMKARVSQDTWAAEMLCLRPSRSHSVYPAFDAATHVVGDPPPATFERFIGGMDFGYRSEGVLLLAGVDHDQNVTVLREFVRTGAGVDEFADALDRWVAQGLCTHGQIDFIGVDPAGNAHTPNAPFSCVQILRARGLRIRSRSMGIAPSIALVTSRIAPTRGVPGVDGANGDRPRLVVHESCSRLIECLTRYRYNPDKPESVEPMKDGHDHAPDALRYMIIALDAATKTEVSTYTGP